MSKILVLLGGIAQGAGNATELDAVSKKIVNVAQPVAAQDASTKKYVDDELAAISFLDGDFRISNTTDDTKKIAYDLSSIATSTVRTISMPDANVNLALIASALQKVGGTMSGAINMGSNKVEALADGTIAADAVNKGQMDAGDGALQTQINGLASGSTMREFSKVITNDAAPVEAVALSTLLPFSDDDLPTQVAIGDFAAGDFIVFDADGTPALGQIYDDVGTLKITFIGVALVADKLYAVRYNLLAGTDAGETMAIFSYVAGAMLKVADLAWNTAIGIGLGTFTSGAGVISAADTVLTAIQKLSGNEAAHSGSTSNPHAVTKAQILAAESIVNADVDAGAAIAESKLALVFGTSALNTAIGNHTSTVTGNPHAVTKAEILAAESIVNADVDAAAAIVESKLSLDFGTSALNTAIADAKAQSASVGSPEVCGEAFEANQVHLVRFAKDGETAGRIYKSQANTIDNANIIGAIIVGATGLSIADSADLVEVGDLILGSVDTPFIAANLNKLVFLSQTVAGKWTLAPTEVTGDLLKPIGIVKTTGIIKIKVGETVQA